jgi:hypothetical protein
MVTESGNRPGRTPFRVRLRPPQRTDEAAFVAAAHASRRLHGHWVLPPRDAATFAAYVRRYGARGEPQHAGFLVERVGVAVLNDSVMHGALKAFLNLVVILPGLIISRRPFVVLPHVVVGGAADKRADMPCIASIFAVEPFAHFPFVAFCGGFCIGVICIFRGAFISRFAILLIFCRCASFLIIAERHVFVRSASVFFIDDDF